MSLGQSLALRGLAVRQAGRIVARRPGAALLAWVLASIALTALLAVLAALPMGAAAWRSVQQLNQAEAVVFLVPAGPDGNNVAQRLTAVPGVTSVQPRPRDAALAELMARAGGNAKPIAGLRANPLPDAVVVRFAAATPPATVDGVLDDVRGWPGVALVHHDAAWQRRLGHALRVTVMALTVVGAAAAVSLIVALAAAVRLVGGLDAREARLLHLAGASAATVRRPAMYCGALLLAAAAMAAAALVAAGVPQLTAAVQVLRLPAATWPAALSPAAALAAFVVAAAVLGAALGSSLAPTHRDLPS